MHKIHFLFLLTLLSTTTIFCETDSSKKTDSQEKPQISEYQQQLRENKRKAAGFTMEYDQELFENLYAQAPQDIKDCVELLKKASSDHYNSRTHLQILPKRMLLVGPPGVGKSTLAQVIAYQLGRDFFFIKVPLLGNEYRNSEIATLAALIREAIDFKKPCVIILDEINIITEKKHGIFEDDLNIAAGLWVLLDSCAKYPHIFIVATANDVSKLPEQLKDRFEGTIFEIYADNAHSRYRVLEHHLSKADHFVGKKYLKELASKTDQFSPRQLEILVRIAQQKHFLFTGFVEGVCEEELEYAYKKILAGSQMLVSKKSFSLKKWILENGPLIHSISTSVSLGATLFGIGYFILGNKTPRPAQPA